jgi:hypothetical protein
MTKPALKKGPLSKHQENRMLRALHVEGYSAARTPPKTIPHLGVALETFCGSSLQEMTPESRTAKPT